MSYTDETIPFGGPAPRPARPLRPVADGDAPPSVVIAARKASTYAVRRTRWLWHHRVPAGALSLLAGREGLGKSTVAYDMAARITRGKLEGSAHGTPRPVVIVATEDSWEATVVPRLIAHDADLDLVYNVAPQVDGHRHGELSLPEHVDAFRDFLDELRPALVIFDPLMSRLSAKLDAHRDGEVRQALEPIVRAAQDTGTAVLGLIHHNKTGGTDPLDKVMGSRAFAAVARAVHTVVADPDDEDGRRRIFGTVKSNLGPLDQGDQAFTIQSVEVGEDAEDGEPVVTGRVKWEGASALSVRDAMSTETTTREERAAKTEAADWLVDWLADNGGEAPSADVFKAGRVEGHAERTLRRAAETRGVKIARERVKGGRTIWSLDA